MLCGSWFKGFPPPDPRRCGLRGFLNRFFPTRGATVERFAENGAGHGA